MGDENPDWLPAGWMVTVKVRNYGRKDKYYINPSNGLKLNSKAEVLRHLESCSGEVQKAKDLNKVNIETSAVEKLPPGWIKEIRTVKKRGRARKEPYYTDPVSGREFRSLQEVLQYLDIEDLRQTKHKPDEKDQLTAKLEDHSQSSSAEVIDKEADTTISRCKRVKPEVEVGGSSVVSTLKTVNVAEKNNQVEHKEEDDSLAMEVSDKLQSVSRAERYAYRIRKRESDGGDHISKSEISMAGSKAVSPKKVERQKETYVEQKVREDDPLAVDLPNKLQNGEEHREGEITQNKLAANNNLENNATGDQSLQSGSKDETKTDVPETNSSEQTGERNSVGDQQQENVANPPYKTKKPNRISATELPRRTSKRLAHVEVNPSLEIKPTKKPEATPTLSGTVQVNNTKNSGHVRFGSGQEPEIDITGENGQLDEPNKHFTECKTENLISDKQKELVRSLFEDPCFTEDLNGVCVEIKEDEIQVEPALENLLMDPCYGFAIKTLKGDIPIEEAKKVDNIINNAVAPPNEAPASSSSTVLPAGNIWDDPSFEFAVKMLTSDSPTNDGSHFSISFEQSLCSSGASRCNDLALPKPSLGDSNYLFSGFDSEKKPLPLPNNIVNGSISSSSEQFQPFATGSKGQGRKFGEL